MKQENIILGIDVSKLTLDIAVVINDEIEDFQINNTPKDIKKFIGKLVKQQRDGKVLIGIENTGIYNWNFYSSIESLNVSVFVINPLHLKKSMGLVRGKNDCIDAQRIALFVIDNQHKLTPTQIQPKQLRKLKLLVAYRKRLIKAKTTFKISSKELAIFKDKELSKTIEVSSDKVIKLLDNQVKAIETQIHNLITSCAETNHKYDLITSVPGVGKVLAWELLIKTNLFQSISDPRKLACYAGVVPFGFQSGTSIYKKPRVSVYADRALKKLLHLAALRVTQLDGEMREYYLRKVDEGKNKMSVINALRNKIVARVCATINNDKPYQKRLVLS